MATAVAENSTFRSAPADKMATTLVTAANPAGDAELTSAEAKQSPSYVAQLGFIAITDRSAGRRLAGRTWRARV
jgi:hypothetical protein